MPLHCARVCATARCPGSLVGSWFRSAGSRWFRLGASGSESGCQLSGQWSLSSVTFRPELASPWGGHHSILSLKVDKRTRELSFSGLSFKFPSWFHKFWLQRVDRFLWAMTTNLVMVLSKHRDRSPVTFVPFLLECESYLDLEDWYIRNLIPVDKFWCFSIYQGYPWYLPVLRDIPGISLVITGYARDKPNACSHSIGISF